MANKTNFTTASGVECYRLVKKVGMKKNKNGDWVPDRKAFYGKNKKEAEAKYQEYIKAPSKESKKLFGAMMKSYIDNVFLKDDTYKPTTQTRYIDSYVDIFEDDEIMAVPLAEVTGLDLQRVFSESDKAASSKKAAYKLIRAFYKYLSAQHIAPDVSGGIVIPKPEHKREDQGVDVFTDEELEKFITLTPEDHRLRLMIILAIKTGARIAEICALTYDDIQGDQLMINKSLAEIYPPKTEGEKAKAYVEISSTKTKASIRSIPLDEMTLAEIRRHKMWHMREMLKNNYRTNQIFTTSTGELYFKSSTRKALKRLCNKVKVEPKSWHTFRHTFGTKLAAAGVPIQTVSKLMGHSDISVTAQYYINIADSEKRNAIAALAI